MNKVAGWYTERLVGKVVTPLILDGFYSSWSQYTIMLDSKEQRNELQKKLKAVGIPSMIYYPRGLHHQTAYKWMNLDQADYQNTIYATEHVLSLPMHPYLEEKTVDEISKNILDNLKGME